MNKKMKQLHIQLSKQWILFLCFTIVCLLRVTPLLAESATLQSSNSNTFKIKGVVTDDQGETLPATTIILNEGKDKKHVFITDIDGKFELSYPIARQVSLTFTFTGMKEQVFLLCENSKPLFNDNTYLKVKLKYNTEVLSEVVVTGYGNISKKTFTGSATTISKKEILKTAPKNVLGALQVMDPSLRMGDNMLSGSNPNAIPDIAVRGSSGIGVTDLDKISSTSLNNNPNLPTFILDGFEVSVSKIFDLDVNRIESMTLLKDAAATAMYGSRAANGVLVITTVTPQSGRVNVNYSANFGLSTPDLSFYNLMNPEQKLEIERLAGLYEAENPSRKAYLESVYNRKKQNIERGVNTNWLELPLRTGFSQKHNLYIEGGEKSIRYGADIVYDRNNGVMRGSYRQKVGAGLSLSYEYKKFNIRNYISFDNITGVESPYGTFSEYAKMNPYDTYVDEKGNIAKDMIVWDNIKRRNPIYDATLPSYDEVNSKLIRDNLEVRWKITDKINMRASASIYYDIEKGQKFRDPDATYFLSVSDKGDLRLSDRDSWGYDASVLGFYNGYMGNHYLNLSVGVNVKETNSTSRFMHYTGFPEGGLSSPEFAEKLKFKPTTNTEINRLFGTLLMANYSYNNIYLLDVSGRIDGSSQFGSKRKFSPFGSGGAGINIHNYSAVKNHFDWIEQLKVRASYGQTGKVNFPSYTAQDKFFFIVDNWFTTGSAAILNYMGNPNLKWETTNTFDVGFELSIFKNLAYIKLNHYLKNTRDLIADMTIASSSGFTSYKENVGEVRNKGWEYQMRIKAIGNKNSQLYFFGNLSNNRNQLVKISNSMKSYNERVNELFDKDVYANDKPMLKYYEGASLTSIYGMQSLGIDPATGKELYQYNDGTVGTEWKGRENIVIGDMEPTLSGSFGANFSYKGFSADAYFRYELGADIYNTTLLDKVERADPNFNCDIRVLTDRWLKPGDISSFKSIRDWNIPTKPTSRFIQKNNWLKLNSVSVGYEIPQRLIKKWHIKRLKVQFNCSDLFTVSSVKMEKGTAYPFARGYNLSLFATL